jgi:hypothetical protein
MKFPSFVSVKSESAIHRTRPGIGSAIPILVYYYGVSSLLLFASFAKLWMLLQDPFVDIRTGFPNWLIWISILIEIAMAVYFATPGRHAVKPALIFVLFTIFFLHSSGQWIAGKQDCGCFGKFESHPSSSMAISGLVLLLNLISVRTSGITFSSWRRGFFKEIRFFFEAIKLGLPGLVSGFVFFGSVLFLVMGNIGYEESIKAKSINLGEIRGTTDINIFLENLSDEKGRVVGVKSSCSCLIVLDPDLQIQAKDSLCINGIIRPSKEGKFHHRVVFFLDHPRQISTFVDVFGFFVKRKETLQ